MSQSRELRDAILEVSQENSWDPEDIATVMSYETAGTFDPWQPGPRTQWGQHRGLIQWGEPQAEKYGVSQDTPVRDQVRAAGQYLLDNGVEPGDGILRIYAAINAGDANKFNASDEDNGGAPGTVRDKVNFQMDEHRENARALLGDTSTGTVSHPGGADAEPLEQQRPIPQFEGGEGTSLHRQNRMEPMTFEPMTADEMPDRKDDPGSIQLWKDAFTTQSTIAAINRHRPEMTLDPEFELTEGKVQELLGDDLDPQRYAEWFSRARSEEHARSIREAALKNEERETRLAEAGWSGAARRMAAELLDPVALGAEALTLGAAAPFIRTASASRAVRAGHSALLGGTAGVAGTAATVPIVPERDGWDVLAGGVFGAGFGAAVGALTRNPAMQDVGAEMSRMQRTLLDNMDSPGSTVGAARTPAMERLLNEELAQIGDSEVPKAMWGNLRFDNMGIIMRSKNPVTRLLGQPLAKDAATPGPMTASEDTLRFFDAWTGDYFRSWTPAQRAFLEDANIKPWQYRKKREATTEFHEEIGRYVRDENPADGRYSPHVMKVGNKIRSLQDHIRKIAQNPRMMEGLDARAVAGFEELADNPNYMMRVFDSNKVHTARNVYGDEGLQEAVFAGMRAARPDVEEVIQRKAAAGFARAITNNSIGLHHLEGMAANRLSSNDIEDIADILRTYGGMSENEAASILSSYSKKTDTGRTARGRSRVLMKENTEVSLRRRDGTGVDKVTLQDLLLVNDANYLFGRYARQMAGRIAMARYRVEDPRTKEVLVDGITNDAEFTSNVLNPILKSAADRGLSDRVAQSEADRMAFMYNWIVGRPTHRMDNSQWGDFLRVMEKFNYNRIMNQAGFAQIPDLAGIMGASGWKAMLSQMPAMRRAVDEAGDWSLQNGLARDLEEGIAVGLDRLTRNDYMRMDDMSGSPFNTDRGSKMNDAENVLNSWSRMTSDLSGMNVVNVGMQRWMANSMVQRFVDMANGGRRLTERRLRSYGISEEMTQRIFRQLRDPDNVTTEKGVLTGNKVKRMHFERWQDPEAREAFKSAIYRATRQAVQQNDIGMVAQWMSHPMGRIFMQFRSFIFGAFTNNLMHNVHLAKGGDIGAMTFFLFSSMLGGLSYAVRTKIAAIGREDADEYLEERLDPMTVGLASFERSGYSSVLPMLFDTTILGRGTGQNWFDFRTTGQATDLIFGNPTADAAQSAVNFLDAIAHPLLNERGMTKQEIQSLFRVLPFSNAIPMVMLMNTLARGRDERPPSDDFEDVQALDE